MLLALIFDSGIMQRPEPTLRQVIAVEGLVPVIAAHMASLQGLGVAVANPYAPDSSRQVNTDPQEPIASSSYSPAPGIATGHLSLYLSRADAETYDAAAEAIEAAIPQLTGNRLFEAVCLLPDRTDLVNNYFAQVKAGTEPGPEVSFRLLYLGMFTDDPELRTWALSHGDPLRGSIGCYAESSQVAIDQLGTAAVELLGPDAEHEEAAAALTRIGTPEAVAALAKAAPSSKAHLVHLNTAVANWPDAALAALAGTVASGGAPGNIAKPLLNSLVVENPELAAQVLAHLSGRPREALASAIERTKPVDYDFAGPDELPDVLATPPWKRPKPKTQLPELDLGVLDMEPAEEWPPGAKERVPQVSGYPARGATDIWELFITSVGGGRGLTDAETAALLQPAQSGDVDAFATAWHSIEVRLREKSRYNTLRVWPKQFLALGDFGIEAWNRVIADTTYRDETSSMLAQIGLRGLPGLATLLETSPATEAKYAAPFGATSLALPMARGLARLKSIRDVAANWLKRWPAHAAAGLLPVAFGPKGTDRDDAQQGLRWLDSIGAAEIITEVAAAYEDPEVMDALAALRAQDQLVLSLPTRLPALPAWWSPGAWARLQLKTGGYLDDEATATFGTMLAIPVPQGHYPGVMQAAEAMTPESCARFGWDMFTAWLSAGANSKEQWAMTSLGVLGDDEVARQITPLIRAWPGESQHKRAVTGLAVLSGIGSDVALMQLNGIAQKVKFKALQEEARVRITQIAHDRQMTPEELADRLAPDLGLDDAGTMRLDFGPRWFTVGFDETLTPFVRDETGARLKALPKPRQSDDAELAKAATAAFSALKKDVRTVAKQQIWRLESAMRSQRRWSQSVFGEFLATHPLVRHIVQRLVWGAFDADGRLVQVFRVAEDASLTDSADEQIELPTGAEIGLVHPLQLDDQQVADFGQLFADYELAQPFEQLGRDTYALTETERQATELTRYGDRKFPSPRLLGLVDRGWRRGAVLDNGWVGDYWYVLPDGREAVLNLKEGLIVGYADFEPEQSGITLKIGVGAWDKTIGDALGTLDVISASELIRELERLTAQ